MLQLYLFGTARIVESSRGIERRLPLSAASLFGYLVINRKRWHPRGAIADHIGDYQSDAQASRCLRSALWRLRRILEAPEISQQPLILVNSNGDVRFNLEARCWIDIDAFEARARGCLENPAGDPPKTNIRKLERTLILVTGSLMEGIYHDWVLRERERMRDLYLDSLALMMRFYEREEAWTRSINYGQQLVRMDPLREEVHRNLMLLFVKSGDRTRALRQYTKCAAILERELGVQPMEETQELYQRLRSNCRRKPDFAWCDGLMTPNPDIALKKFQQAENDLENSLSNLKAGLDIFEKTRAVHSTKRVKD